MTKLNYVGVGPWEHLGNQSICKSMLVINVISMMAINGFTNSREGIIYIKKMTKFNYTGVGPCEHLAKSICMQEHACHKCHLDDGYQCL